MSKDDELVATASQTVGPFFHIGLHDAAGRGASPGARDEIAVRVRVLDGDGAPVNDAVIEYWASGAGQGFSPAKGECGRVQVDAEGACEIRTARPRAHLNLCVFARGLLHHLFTRIYFPEDAGDAALARDPVLALVPADRRGTLLAGRDPAGGRWLFDIRLQGPGETVFFTQ